MSLSVISEKGKHRRAVINRSLFAYVLYSLREIVYFITRKGYIIMSFYPPTDPQNQPTYQTPPQHTQYPPQFAPPPPAKRNRRIWPWIVGAIIAIILISAAFSKPTTQTSSTPPAATEQPTYPPLPTLIPTDTPTPAPNSIGQPVVVNADWTVTLNKVFKSTGDSFNTPKAGYIYLVVNVTLLNTSGQNQTASTLAQWSLKDESGQTYEQDIFFSGSPD